MLLVALEECLLEKETITNSRPQARHVQEEDQARPSITAGSCVYKGTKEDEWFRLLLMGPQSKWSATTRVQYISEPLLPTARRVCSQLLIGEKSLEERRRDGPGPTARPVMKAFRRQSQSVYKYIPMRKVL